MNKDPIDNIKKLMNIENDTGLNVVFESLTEQAPVIGKILTSYKIHRLGKRLNKHASKINELVLKVGLIDDAAFTELLKDFIFPKVLQDLLEEDEDNKIGYFLDGFGQVIDNEVHDKSKILLYYDIIRELRFIEIEYLISYSTEYSRYRYEKYYKHNKFPNNPFEDEDTEFNEIRYPIESKLEKIGLINTGRLISYDEVMKRMNDELQRVKRHLASSTSKDDIKLSGFGYKFLSFFYLLDKYKLE